jgi:N-acetylmuramoyl-L-alanine amidase
MRALKLTGVALLACALPLFAAAQTTGSTSNISALLAELQQLEQQITSLAGSSSAAVSATTPAASTSASASVSGPMCPTLYRTLSIGASGTDVASLQTFLAESGFFNAQATGYFGSITQASVASWQESKGVVSGGDANSTGLGVVGPKTRAAISTSCSGGTTASTQTQCLSVSPPSTECPTGWQPVADSAGCTEYYQCTISLPNAATTTSSATVSATTSCPVVQQPICSGTVTPFQTSSNGCVTAYECVL